MDIYDLDILTVEDIKRLFEAMEKEEALEEEQ